jgi:hypothetical protein
VKPTNCQIPPFRGSRAQFDDGNFEQYLTGGGLMNYEAVNSIPLYLNEPKMALDFLVEKLGFAVHGHTAPKNTDGVMVCDSYGNLYEIFSTTRKIVGSKDDFNVVINKTDCIQDFYIMGTKGLSILNKPHYVAEGLTFQILDFWNNKYTFLEKRDYTD